MSIPGTLQDGNTRRGQLALAASVFFLFYQRYLRQRSRPVLIVFEFAGPAWQRALQRARENAGRHAAAAAANPGNREFAEKAKVARYEVQVAVGQRLEPWIERVSLLPEAQTRPATSRPD